MTVFRRAFEQRAFDGPWGPYTSDGRIPPNSLTGRGSSAGQFVNETTALAQADVWACSSLISDSIAMLPWGAVRSTADVRQPVGSQFLDRPHPELDAVEWKGRMIMSAVLRGRAVAAITEYSSRDGYPTAAWPMHPDDYSLRRVKGQLVCKTRTGEVLMPGEYIHMKGLTLPGADTGVGVVDWHRRAIGLGIATEEFGARWYDEGTAPQSILETDEKMTPEAANNELARWIATHQGRRRPALLHSGLKWRPISLTPNESQFIETMRNNSARIAKLFRVPPHMIGETERSTSWGSGIEEQGIGFVVYTLGIWIARLEAAMFPFLPRPQSLKINVAGLLRGNTRDRYLAYAIGRQWGWMSVNDIRALEDLPPVEGGDVYLQPLNMIDAQDALKVLLGPNNSGGGGA